MDLAIFGWQHRSGVLQKIGSAFDRASDQDRIECRSPNAQE
jgi:hypothetical protein